MTLFPTPYLKFQGLMTAFGVCDLERLKEVRKLHALTAEEFE